MDEDLAWIFWISVVVTYIFAFGIGANDVANSFGTSIGSGALTMGQAIVIASIFEVLGAVTLGAGVSYHALKASWVVTMPCLLSEMMWQISDSMAGEPVLGRPVHLRSLMAAAAGASLLNPPLVAVPQVSDTILRQISRLEDGACWDCGGPSGRMRVFMLGLWPFIFTYQGSIHPQGLSCYHAVTASALTAEAILILLLKE